MFFFYVVVADLRAEKNKKVSFVCIIIVVIIVSVRTSFIIEFDHSGCSRVGKIERQLGLVMNNLMIMMMLMISCRRRLTTRTKWIIQHFRVPKRRVHFHIELVLLQYQHVARVYIDRLSFAPHRFVERCGRRIAAAATAHRIVVLDMHHHQQSHALTH